MHQWQEGGEGIGRARLGSQLRYEAVVIPMRIGDGSRLKLLEALAMAAPVVSTTMGAEGIPGLRDGEHLLLADAPAAMAAAVNRLVTDRPFAQQLGQAGRTFVCAGYDWARKRRLYAIGLPLSGNVLWVCCAPAAVTTLPPQRSNTAAVPLACDAARRLLYYP
ncbi:glycosyltransferase [Chloroflexus aggregans]|uniref:glycosyltransferase n=1 Tax=Chloroflexus aggregans TaxID=152260 RepID=UPI001E5ECECC|nr:glycosyltransferase [Chloroflexus aggregans]